MSNHPKELRKAVRNVTQELLPELLKSEVFSGLYERLQKEMISKLQAMQEEINTTLQRMDSRSKDIQQFIMNQVQQELARNTSNDTIDKTTPENELNSL